MNQTWVEGLQEGARRVIAGWGWLVVLVVANGVARLVCLSPEQAPFTDGIFILEQDILGAGQRMPLYPSLAQGLGELLGDGLWGGRLVSVAAGSALAVVVYLLADALAGRRAAWMGAVLYSVSPLPFRWSLRVMTDVTFALMLTAGLWAAAEAGRRPGWRWSGLAIFAFGLGALTRPEGVLCLVPALGIAGWTAYRCGVGEAARSSWGWSSWVAFGLWKWVLTPAGTGYESTADELVGRLTLLNLGTFTSFGGSYLFMGIVTLTPVVAWFAVSGWRRLLESEGAQGPVRWSLAWLVGTTAVLVSVHFFFSTRHLLFLYPALCALAGVGLGAVRRWRWAWFSVAVGWSVALTVVAVVGSQGTFADLRRVSELSRAGGYAGPLLSVDHQQKQTRMFAGAPVKAYSRSSAQSGTRVLLTTFELGRTGMAKERTWLCERFACTVIAEAGSWTLPVLADDIAGARAVNGDMRHTLAHLLVGHVYDSVVIELGEARTPPARVKPYPNAPKTEQKNR